MGDLETWAAGLAAAFAEPDRKTGKTLGVQEILTSVEGQFSRRAPRVADNTIIPEGGFLPKPPEAERDAAVCAALARSFPVTRPEGAALRQNIIDAVEGGEIRPPAAEMWATRFGWPPFAGWAGFEHFDPRSVSSWTLAQVATWIAHREADPTGVYERVSRLDPARIASSTRWIEAGGGYEIGPREDRGYSEPEDERTDSKSQLLAALRAGEIVAEGERDGVARAIPVEEWPRLSVVGFHDERGVWRVVSADQSRGEVYAAVRVPRASVMKLWPAATPFAEPKLRPLTEARARAILESMAADDNGRVPGVHRAEKVIREQGFQGRSLLRKIIEEMTEARGPGRT